MIDTHCHLTFPEFKNDVPRTLAEAAAAGVSGVVSISTTVTDAAAVQAVANAHDRVWFAAGVHPLYADEGPHDWARLRTIAADPKCVAWGELGLDRHYKEPAWEMQLRVLDEQLTTIESARKSGLDKPIVIHCREAFADLIPILKQRSLPPQKYVFHCFTGTLADMRLLLDFGACVSFTGVLTYKNAAEVREAARLAPLDRIMVETDAPFLPPEPLRSKRPCTPAMVRLTAEALAAVHGMPFEQIHAQLNANTARFFGIDAR